MSYVGKLERKGMLRFLKKVESQSRNGLLTIKNGDRRVELYFQHGECISVFDTSMQDTLEDRRLLEEIVNQDINQKVPKVRPARAGKEGNVAHMLVDQGYVTREQIDEWIMRRAGHILQQIFTWSRCEVFFADSVTPPAERLLMTHDRRSLIDALFSEGQLVVSPRRLERRTIKLPVTDESGHGDAKMPPAPRIPKSKPPDEPVQAADQRVPASKLPASAGGQTDHSSRTVSDIPTIFPDGLKDGDHDRQPSGAYHILPSHIPYSGCGFTDEHRFPLLSEMITTAKITVVKHRERSRLYWEIALVVLLLVIAGIVHGVNMFHYPYIEDDEGTYMFQASAVVHIGKLAYYTYWYDHAPAGWIQIALWSFMTGGFHTFGSSIYSGRVLMLIIQSASTLLVYRIGRNISKSMMVPFAAALLFVLSPYGLYYHRRILLDNIATMWMLLSIYWLVSGRPTLRGYWFSAISLAISVLSKEITIFLVPVMLGMVYWRSDRSHRVLAIVGWLTLFSAIVSVYPLMATIKNELLPAGTLLSDHSKHVSLIESLFFQSQRAQDGGIFNAHSMVRTKMNGWIVDDPILCVGGGLSALISLLFLRKRPIVAFVGLATLALSTFLLRNGLVLDFYLVPLLPVLALSLVLVLESLLDVLFFLAQRRAKRVGRVKPNVGIRRCVEQGIILGTVLSTIVYFLYMSHGMGLHGKYLSSVNDPLLYWDGMQANAQTEATTWVEHHLPRSSRLVIDESMGPDLYDDGYKLAHYYWRIAEDPAIGLEVFHDDWHNFDYIITTPQMMDDVRQNNMKLIQDGVAHSTVVAHFIDNSYMVEIRQVNKK